MVDQKKTIPTAIIKEKNKSKMKSNSWLGALLGTIIFLISIVAIVLMILIIPDKAKKISKLRSQNLTSSMSGQDIQLLKQSVEATQAERDALLSAFPSEASLLEFISMIDNLKNDELVVAQFSVDSDIPTKIGKNPSFLPMTLVLRGKPKAVQSALLALEKSQYFIRPVVVSYISDQTGSTIEIKTSFHLYVSEPYAKPKS